MIEMTATRHLPTDGDTDLRDDEAVDPITNLTYFAGLARSPHVDQEGRRV